jgi:HlyD family secretion protein
MGWVRILVLAGVLAAVAGGGYYGWVSYHAAENVGERPLTLYGNVDIRQVDLAFNAEGKIAELLVEEGNRVEAGQLLARLDDTPYRNLVDAAQARLARSRAQLAELEAGTRPPELARARAAVDAAKAAVDQTAATLERRRELLGRGNISQAQFDAAQRAYQEAAARLEQRRQELELAVQGPRQERIAAARAERAFNQATLALARDRLDNTELHSPAEGTVLTRIREAGATVGPTAPVLTLALRTPMRVRTYVGEPNLGRVEPGMPVSVTTDSAPDTAYRGHVGFISPTAEFTPKTVQTEQLRTELVYRVRVIVENPDSRLRQGMPVTVTLRPDAGGNEGTQADGSGPGGS